jgi:uncharacterized protein (TIGR03437 family)
MSHRVDKKFVIARLIACLSFGCSLFAQSGAPTLTPTPATLAFKWQIGSALPAAQTVSVKSGTGSAASSATYSTAVAPVSALWLTVSPNSGKLPTALSVAVNPSSLPVGSYTASVELTAAGFSTPAVIPVTLAVEEPLPTLAISPASLNFVSPPNLPQEQTLQLSTSGGPVPFTAAAQGAAWLTVAPASGVVLPGVPFTLTVSANAASLDPQATPYSGKIVLTASGVASSNKTQNVTVGLLVNSLTPTISSLWPSAALAGSGPLTVTIRGTGFYKATVAKAAGSPTPLKTTLVSPTVLLADVPASLVATAGPLNMVASNPPPGGDSAPAVFTVSATPVVQTVVSAASYASGPVSPGELVTLFGTGIGPATPAVMSVINGYAVLILGGVSLAIDGKNAAMVYVSQNQITVQVPYDVTIGPQKAVVVNNNGSYAFGQVDTTATAPGLFSLDGSGLGQSAALTYSMKTAQYSINGSANPAHAGDIVVLYLTGEGIYATGISPATGYVIPPTLNPLPQLNPLPAVTIGGAPATVQYAGPMVGGILGVLQVNAVVPAASTTGANVPVQVTIAGAATQPGATIVVK